MTTEHQAAMRRELVLLAHCQGVTVPELVAKIKGDMLSGGADPGIEPVITFFESLDAAAALHIN